MARSAKAFASGVATDAAPGRWTKRAGLPQAQAGAARRARNGLLSHAGARAETIADRIANRPRRHQSEEAMPSIGAAYGTGSRR